MKFEVGDVLVDAGRDPEEPRMGAEVLKASKEFQQYTVRVANGKIFNYSSVDAEWIWKKAPVGTVAWLIHELSKFDPLAKVFYTDDSMHWERITDVEERYDGGVSVC